MGDWIRTKPNYARFNRGTRSNNTGETKYAISMEVVNAIKNAGITTPRTQEAVIAKISQLETDYDEAHDWLTGTGSTMRNEATVKAALLMRCRYYYDLYHVMQDRALSNDGPPMIHAFHNASHSDDNHKVTITTRSDQEILDRNKNSANADVSCEIIIQQGREDERDFDDVSGSAALNQTVSDCDEPTKHVTIVEDSCGNSNLSTATNCSKTVCEEYKNTESPVAASHCHDSNDSSHSIMSQWLKANTVMHYEEMNERVARRKLEEKKLKREMKVSQGDYDMRKLKKRKMQMELAMELGRNRVELRKRGVPETEINILLPMDFLRDKQYVNKKCENDGDIDSGNEGYGVSC